MVWRIRDLAGRGEKKIVRVCLFQESNLMYTQNINVQRNNICYCYRLGISALVVDLTSFSHMMLFLYMYQCWINSESGEAISLGAIRKNMEYLANASPREARG